MSTSKKILVIAGGAYVSGAEKVTLDVMEGFKKNGHEVHCMVSGWNNGDFISRINDLHLPYTTIKLGWYYVTKILWSLDSLLHYPKAIWVFVQLNKKFKADIIYTISFRQIILLYPFFKKNIVYHVHDANSYSRKSRLFLHIINKKVKKYIAVSQFIKNDLLGCGLSENKIDVIYNGIEIQSQQIKKISDNDFFKVGIVGQVIRRKGHLLALEALDYLINTNKKIQLVIVGTGDVAFTQELKQRIKELKLNDYVVWKGYIREVPKIYQDLDIVIAPTQNEEPFGLMACEAGMFGIPVIVADNGGLVEIIEDGVNGFTFNAKNAFELADKLSLLYQNENLLLKLGNAGKLKATQQFSKEQMNRKIRIIIDQI
jgi:glycosyltransferase involved in cell wall biosynthesis